MHGHHARFLIFALSLVACASQDGRRGTPKPLRAPATRFSVDATFALAVIEGNYDRRALLNSPAMAAILRHRKMTGAPTDNPGGVLDKMMGRIKNPSGAAKVLQYWRGRHAKLVRCAFAARRHIPDRVSLDGKIILAAGYDIGVASPPDIVLNVAHPHFVAAPAELCHYVTHEVHHVGFLALRKIPDVSSALRTRKALMSLIRFMTQMEGTAVHAAYGPRKTAGALGADADYRVYRDQRHAEQVRRDYAIALRRLERAEVEGKFNQSLAGEVLTTLSSKDRLWYRYGALVARELEQTSGRRALVLSIRQPEPFYLMAAKLLP